MERETLGITDVAPVEGSDTMKRETEVQSLCGTILFRGRRYMREEELRHKVLLPVFQLTELTNQDDPRAIKRTIKQGKGHPATTYFYRFASDKVDASGFNFNLFPVVLDKASAPWDLGTLYILEQLEGQTNPVMRTFHSYASDLGAFKEWLDDHDSAEELLFNFPETKLRRTTYRFRGYLNLQLQAGKITQKTAKRRMGTVIAFYKWLIEKKIFTPEYKPWEESEYRIFYATSDGQRASKIVVRKDISIPAPEEPEKFDGIIQDGGKLRPLLGNEQDWLIEAAEASGNSEYLLIQLFIIGTGARIESVCTLRLKHFENPTPKYSKSQTGDGEVYRLGAGPGTGIETADNKRGTFQVPRDLYELLHTYAISDRAKKRRKKYIEKYGEHSDPYLFITQQGNPYYMAKSESSQFNPNLNRRYEQVGQAIRQFIKDYAIPYVRKHHDKDFFYRPHDLRASFGMNMTEALMKQVQEGTLTLHKARITVADLMWHDSMATTDIYLNYRGKFTAFHGSINTYGKRLQNWIEKRFRFFGQ